MEWDGIRCDVGEGGILLSLLVLKWMDGSLMDVYVLCLKYPALFQFVCYLPASTSV